MSSLLQPVHDALEVLQDQELSRHEIAERLEAIPELVPLLCRLAGTRPGAEVRMDFLLARYGLRRVTEGLERIARRLDPERAPMRPAATPADPTARVAGAGA